MSSMSRESNSHTRLAHRMHVQPSSSFLSQFPLLLAPYQDTTVKNYTASVKSFILWCRELHLRANSIDSLDILVAKYIHHLWITGKGKTEATKVLYGIFMYYPRSRKQLFTSQQCLRGWLKQ